ARRELAEALHADVAAIGMLLDQAIQDPDYQTKDRVDLAEIAGSFKFLSRSLDGFLTVGDTTMAALSDGKRDEALSLSLGFARYAQAFAPALANIRRNIADLNERATRMVLTSQRLDTWLSFGLFVLACGLGLGISAVGSTRVVDGLRQLVASTKA